MQKKFLIGLFLFLSVCSQTFACGDNGNPSTAISNNQKACKNVVSFIFIDFSFLSPRATAADISVGMPKRCMHWMHKCCTPRACVSEGCPSQCCQPQCCTPQCCTTQTCPQPCAPQCCPCAPQCPDCRMRSMAPDENKHEAVASDVNQDGIIPVSNKQETDQQCVTPKSKTHIYKIDFLRHFKSKQEKIVSDNKQDELIPVTNKQETEQQCTSPKNKTSMFRVDLFRRFKFQIL